jgi:hypothetical protein
MSLVITSIALILVVGVAIEPLIFAPLERHVLVRDLTIRSGLRKGRISAGQSACDGTFWVVGMVS